MNEKKITFRMAKEKDAGLVMSFIRQLSVYEEMEVVLCQDLVQVKMRFSSS